LQETWLTSDDDASTFVMIYDRIDRLKQQPKADIQLHTLALSAIPDMRPLVVASE
jgi:hypothetical protein